jgi:hypothetical protein
MEQFKIECFEKDNPNEKFPKVEQISTTERQKQIRSRLALLVGYSQCLEPLELAKALLANSRIVINSNAMSKSFDLSKVIRSLDINPQKYVYINWDRFSTIDRMVFGDLCKYFDYIWYPAADDIDVFDDTLSWVLLISHSGTVREIHSKVIPENTNEMNGERKT